MRISDWSSDVCSSDLQGLFGRDGFDAIVYSRRIEFDLGAVGPSVAGPTRPDQLVGLEDVSASFARQFPEPAATVRPPVLSPVLSHGQIVLAAITSCTNTARSEESRVGKECVSPCRYGGSTCP